MTTEEWFDKATAYFGGAMTEEEMLRFEKETGSSEELSALMKLWKDTDDEAALYEQYKTEADALMATHQKLKAGFIEPGEDTSLNDTVQMIAPSKRVKMSTRQWIAIAAVLTGVIFLVELISSNNYKPGNTYNANTGGTTNTISKDSGINLANETKDSLNKNTAPLEEKADYERLYAQNFAPDHVPDDQGGPLENAFFYYESAQYKNAITAIDNAKNATATRGNTAFTPLTEFYSSYYKALSMMSLGSMDGAIPLLQDCIQQGPTNALKANAQWYLSLAYLHEENATAATQALQSLITNPAATLYKKKAETILAALKK